MIKPPVPVTLIALTVLTITTWNGLRLYETISNWEILQNYNSQPGPLIMSVISLVWILIGLVAIFGLFIGKSSWLLFIKLATILFTLWYWVDRLLFQKTLITHLFPIVLTGFMLLFVSILINHRYTQYYFKQRETHDRKLQN